MAEFHDNEYVAGRGTTALGIIGTVLGGLAAAGGGLGNALGGYNGYNGYNACGGHNYYDAAIAEKDSIIAELKSERYTDRGVLDLYKYVDKELKDLREQSSNRWSAQYVNNAQVQANIACNTANINNLACTLGGLTKTVIPISNVCPTPMMQYNSWVAPAATAAESPTGE